MRWVCYRQTLALGRRKARTNEFKLNFKLKSVSATSPTAPLSLQLVHLIRLGVLLPKFLSFSPDEAITLEN